MIEYSELETALTHAFEEIKRQFLSYPANLSLPLGREHESENMTSGLRVSVTVKVEGT